MPGPNSGSTSLTKRKATFVVRASTDVTSMSTRFLIGLLQPSVEHFGDRDRFFEHYHIDGNPTLVSQIRRAVEYSLLPDTQALAKSER